LAGDREFEQLSASDVALNADGCSRSGPPISESLMSGRCEDAPPNRSSAEML
jgi:hypothetical protein